MIIGNLALLIVSGRLIKRLQIIKVYRRRTGSKFILTQIILFIMVEINNQISGNHELNLSHGFII